MPNEHGSDDSLKLGMEMTGAMVRSFIRSAEQMTFEDDQLVRIEFRERSIFMSVVTGDDLLDDLLDPDTETD